MANNDTIKKTISQNISYYRKKAGLSQKEFAAKLGAAPSRISSWETGANSTDIDTLFEICSILNVSINDMCGVYPDSSLSLSYPEQEHIKKYRNLDDHGREMVDIVLEKEYDRCHPTITKTAAFPKQVLNAAHAIDGSSQEDIDHDETIMNAENC
ncbi:MAG TPA: helix-turn-helix transcriptional regulator [Candidatus Scatomonas pullistercoris]|uniref:Helix-turn-helix transcriptional regulator n=1 Tax=Candidatus Scatomonas pullistercoris TaxID=2840920 RepID=A0A9D1P4S1_9FIRM|nr:helix-turn-helix transcriptional regulator [Candidatus Scatomonas pullistercoris]